MTGELENTRRLPIPAPHKWALWLICFTLTGASLVAPPAAQAQGTGRRCQCELLCHNQNAPGKPFTKIVLSACCDANEAKANNCAARCVGEAKNNSTPTIKCTQNKSECIADQECSRAAAFSPDSTEVCSAEDTERKDAVQAIVSRKQPGISVGEIRRNPKSAAPTK